MGVVILGRKWRPITAFSLLGRRASQTRLHRVPCPGGPGRGQGLTSESESEELELEELEESLELSEAIPVDS